MVGLAEMWWRRNDRAVIKIKNGSNWVELASESKEGGYTDANGNAVPFPDKYIPDTVVRVSEFNAKLNDIETQLAAI